MLKKWLIRFEVAFTIVVVAWSFPGNSIAEEPFSQNQTATPLNLFPAFPADLCNHFVPGDLRNLCKKMELEKLPNIGNQKNLDLLAFPIAAQKPVEIFKDPEAFRKITKDPEKLARRLGFESVEHLAKVQEGACLMVSWVELEPLSKYENGDDPKKLLRFSDRVILPLNDETVGDKSKDARSSLTFTLFRKVNEARWTGRGLPNFIRKADEYGKNQTGQKLVVEIPGLNLRFLGVSEETQLMLIPFSDRKFSMLELKAGDPLPANEVFTGLAPEAKKRLIPPPQDDFLTRDVVR